MRKLRALCVLCFTLGVLRLALGGTPVAIAGDPTARPHPPYVVWFQPKFFAQAPDLYRHLILDAGGTESPALLARHDAAGLAWAYGINNPDAKDPSYWRDICGPDYRRWAGLGKKPGQVASRIVRPGVALDEWCNPVRRNSEQWAAAGLRQGRKQWPKCSAWVRFQSPSCGLPTSGSFKRKTFAPCRPLRRNPRGRGRRRYGR